nr:MAG TPA: hypothetical protein [Caudoviricetes sp.]
MNACRAVTLRSITTTPYCYPRISYTIRPEL